MIIRPEWRNDYGNRLMKRPHKNTLLCFIIRLLLIIPDINLNIIAMPLNIKGKSRSQDVDYGTFILYDRDNEKEIKKKVELAATGYRGGRVVALGWLTQKTGGRPFTKRRWSK